MSEFLPPVVGKLLGDTSDFTSKMGAAGRQFATETDEMGRRAGATKATVGAGLAAVGGLMTGAGAGLEHLGHDLEVQEKSLEVAITNTGKSYDQYAGKIDKTEKSEEKFGHTKADSAQALAILTRATGDANKSLDDMALVTELAAVKHISLADAANTVAKMHAGAYRPLKEFGINIADNKAAVTALAKAQTDSTSAHAAYQTATQKLADLEAMQAGKANLTVADHIRLRDAKAKVADASSKMEAADQRLTAATNDGAKAMDFNQAKALVMAKAHGTAEAQADTFGGKLTALRTRAEDMAATVGTKVGPALTMLGPLLLGVSGLLTSSVVPAIASATLAALPWIAGIGAVVAAGYLLYTNWDTIVGFLKGIVTGAWNFIHDHFSQIAMFIALPIAPLLLLGQHFGTVLHGIQSVASSVWGVVEGLFKGGVNGIIHGVNAFIRALDSIHFSVHLPDWLPGIGGKGFDWKGLNIPTIPTLQTGGNVSQGGIAEVGEAGRERIYLPPGAEVTPLRSGSPAMGGGDTHVHIHLEGATIIGGDRRQVAEDLAGPMRDALIRAGLRQQLGLAS